MDPAAVEAWAAKSRAADKPAADAEKAPPRTIGEFELLSRLGQGGMGVVFRARQPSLGREVALKCLLASGDPKAQIRFAREMRALARVEHPHLVKIFTSGSDGDQWFYAMELIDGVDLAAVCTHLAATTAAELGPEEWTKALSDACTQVRQQEVPLKNGEAKAAPLAAVPEPAANSAGTSHQGGRAYIAGVVTLVRQAAAATHALHEARIVHRDIKPGNIMVSPDGGHAVLMDLGLAQLADEVEGRLTRTRQFVGTLRYASPEQVMAVARLDARADVYSLGATLWELLTLRPLFGAEEDTPIPELMLKIPITEPDRPRKFNRHVPSDLEAIALKCLEKEPARRYATAAELADDLDCFLAGEPVKARPVRGWERAWKWGRRRPAMVALLALTVLLLLALGAGAVSLLYSGRLETALDDVQTQRNLAETRRLEAENQRRLAEDRGLDSNRQRALAEEQRSLARRYLYFGHMNLAQQAWQEGNIPRMLQLLDGHQPDKENAEDLRGLEWHYLLRLAQRQRAVFPHKDWVQGVAVSPDGKRLASAVEPGAGKVWEVSTGKDQFSFSFGPVPWTYRMDLAFSPNGKVLAAWGLWETQAGRSVRSDPKTQCFGFSSDSKYVASLNVGAFSTGPDSAAVWEVANLAVPTCRMRAGRLLECGAFSPDGKVLACATRSDPMTMDIDILVTAVPTGKPMFTLKGHRFGVTGLAISADSKLLASAGSGPDFAVKVWDLATGTERASLTGHLDEVVCVAFSPDGRFLASGAKERTIRIWHLATNKTVLILRGHADAVSGLAFFPRANYLASSSFDRTVRMWNAQPGDLGRNYAGVKAESRFYDDPILTAAAFGTSGVLIALPGKENSIAVWDAAHRKRIQECRGHTGAVTAVAFSADGRRLVSTAKDQTVKVWDVVTGTELRSLPAPSERGAQAQYLFLSGDDHYLAVEDKELWDLQTGKSALVLPHELSIYPPSTVAFSADARSVAVAYRGGLSSLGKIGVYALGADPAQPLLSLEGDRVAFSPDGKHLATAAIDGIVKVWDLQTHKPLHVLKGHVDRVLGVIFSPDGSRLASVSRDRSVKLWAPATGQEALSLTFSADDKKLRAARVLFSQDGKRLAVLLDDGRIKEWDSVEPSLDDIGRKETE